MLRDDPVGVREGMSGRDVILVEASGARQELEERFVELLVVEFADERRVRLANRFIGRVLSLVGLVDGDEGRPRGNAGPRDRRRLRFLANEALHIQKRRSSTGGRHTYPPAFASRGHSKLSVPELISRA